MRVICLTLFAAGALTASNPAVAQPRPLPRDDARVHVDLQLVGASSTVGDAREFLYHFILFGERATMHATYDAPSLVRGVPFDVSGGVRLGNRWSVVVGHTRTSRSLGARLTATIPDPGFYGAPATHTAAATTDLWHRESAWHVAAAIDVLRRGRTLFRLYGGPSIFTYDADLVQNVRYEQTADSLHPANRITVVGDDRQRVSASRLGGHAGADVTVSLTRLIGLIGGARYGRARVPLPTEPLSKVEQPMDLGGLSVYGGVRLRIGGRR